jgi:hypothetical protein
VTGLRVVLVDDLLRDAAPVGDVPTRLLSPGGSPCSAPVGGGTAAPRAAVRRPPRRRPTFERRPVRGEYVRNFSAFGREVDLVLNAVERELDGLVGVPPSVIDQLE